MLFLKPTLGIILVSFFLSCHSGIEETSSEKIDSSNLYFTKSDDAEMNIAIANARNNLSVFDSAFKSNRYDSTTFAIKVRFPTEKGSEHIWITRIEENGGQYYGVMDDIPELTTAVKQGDRIAINKDDISDWMFVDNGVLRGGYTIKTIRSRLNEQEKNDFDKNFDFRIED